jgi:precorrin-6B methylase 2
MHAMTALGLLEKKGERFVNTGLTSRYLVSGKEDYRGAIVKHIHHCWRGWTNLGETLVLGHPPDVDPQKWVEASRERDEEEVKAFIWGMDAVSRDVAPKTAAKLDLAGVRHLLDLGGGPATYAIAFVQAHPQLQATVFDLPLPIKIAQENIARHGLTSRIDTLAGNFLQDDIGAGYDYIWISAILHSHTEEQCQLIIGKAVKALAPGGKVAIQDSFLDDDGQTPPGGAMFAVHMLAVTPGGRSYYWREVSAWMEEAGLTTPVQLQTTPDHCVLMAKRI